MTETAPMMAAIGGKSTLNKKTTAINMTNLPKTLNVVKKKNATEINIPSKTTFSSRAYPKLSHHTASQA